MFTVAIPRNKGISAPQIDMGTLTRITIGSRKLSKLGRKHEIDHDQREDEGVDELIAFLNVLPRESER